MEPVIVNSNPVCEQESELLISREESIELAIEMSDEDVLRLIDVSNSFSKASSCRIKFKLGEIWLLFDCTCSNAASKRNLRVNIK